MKAILAVAIFGIMTYVSAQVSSSQCQTYKLMQNFEPSKFFSGSWFVTHAKNGPDFAVCRTYKTSLSGRNIEFTGDGYYGNNKANSYYKVRCTGPKNSGKKDKFSLSCNVNSPSISSPPTETNIAFNLDLTIIKTDYSQYAILYRCDRFPTQKVTKDNLMVLHRAENGIAPNIANIFQQATRKPLSGLRFIRQNTNCKEMDNHITDDSIDELLKY